jgi:hypothetical protein
MTLPLRPKNGRFLRPFGCGTFIRDFLLGNGSHGSPVIRPEVGAPQANIFYQYKQALRRITSEDKAVSQEERKVKREKRQASNPRNMPDMRHQDVQDR